VLRKSLAAFHERYPALRRALLLGYRAQREAYDAEGRQTAVTMLQTSLKDLESSSTLESEMVAAAARVRKSYKLGRSVFRHARRAKGRTDEALHEWRKQAKYLLNEFELIQAVFHVTFNKRHRFAHALAEILGDDQDLAVLVMSIRKHRMRHPSLEKAIQKQRRTLQRDALRMGAKLYHRMPGRFTAKITRQLARAGQRPSSHHSLPAAS
jgi:CHAD domain-containing protein